jgi:hypothetical protein
MTITECVVISFIIFVIGLLIGVKIGHDAWELE